MAVATVRPREAEGTRAPESDGLPEWRPSAPVPLPRPGPDARDQPLLLAVLALGAFWAVEATTFGRAQWWTVALLLAGLLVAFAVVRGARYAAWATLAHAVAVGVAVRVSLAPFVQSDVVAASAEAVRVLLRGDNPYTHTYLDSIPAGTPLPYPPGEILFYTLPHLLFGGIAEVDRWAGVAVVLLLAALAPCVGPVRAALATALYGAFSFAAFLALDGSNDTSLAFLVVLAVVLLVWSERGGRAGRLLFLASAVFFGWALVFKQLTVFVYPLIVTHLRRRGAPWLTHAAVALGVALLVCLPFFAAAPADFVDRVVGLPPRPTDEVWGLNLWAGLQRLIPGLVDLLNPALPVLGLAATAVVGGWLLAWPAATLGGALFQGLLLLFTALFLARWTAASYYAFAAALVAVALAVHQPAFAGHMAGFPEVRAFRRLLARPAVAPAVPAAAALTCALLAALLAWSSGWFAADTAAGGPFRVAKPEVALADGQLAVATSVTSHDASGLRAWFFLTHPSEPTPWEDYTYRSPTVQVEAAAEQPAVLQWSDTIALPDGMYELTIWFHKRVNDEWVHLTGGEFDSTPLLVEDDTARPLGPFRLATEAAIPTLRAGTTNPLDLEVTGSSTTARCRIEWQLTPGIGDPPVARGEASWCARPLIDLPPTLSSGDYTLELAALAIDRRVSHASDRLTLPVAVVDASSEAGPFRFDAEATLPPLTAGETTTLDLPVTETSTAAACQSRWVLTMSAGGRPMADGDGGTCAAPEITLPATLQPGNYVLEVTALAVAGERTQESDRVTYPVVVEAP